MDIQRKMLDLIDDGDVNAHCDLFCGVYDPAQARIEAQAVYNAVKIYHNSSDDVEKQRALNIKEERAELVKHHLWVLWTDYIKPHHLDQLEEDVHDLFWKATKAAGEAKKTVDIDDAQNLIDLVDEVGRVFAKTKEVYDYDAVKRNMEHQSK